MRNLLQNYESPEIEYIEISVEKGFAGSPEDGGDITPPGADDLS